MMKGGAEWLVSSAAPPRKRSTSAAVTGSVAIRCSRSCSTGAARRALGGAGDDRGMALAPDVLEPRLLQQPGEPRPDAGVGADRGENGLYRSVQGRWCRSGHSGARPAPSACSAAPTRRPRGPTVPRDGPAGAEPTQVMTGLST